MSKKILIIFLIIILLPIITLLCFYLYLRLHPNQVITIPSNPLTDQIIQNSTPQLSSCSTDQDCSWYDENIGTDTPLEWCSNQDILKQCPSCISRSLDSILAEENVEGAYPCLCQEGKCQMSSTLVASPQSPSK